MTARLPGGCPERENPTADDERNPQTGPIFLDVGLPLPLAPFTYHLRPELLDIPVAPGCRVLVPFRGRPAVGFVVSVHDRRPEFATQPILELLDPTPLLDETLLGLARWLAEHALCSLGEALNAMIPGGIKRRVRRLLSVRSPLPDDRDCVRPAALTWLEQHPRASYEGFRRAHPKSLEQLGRWLADGRVVMEHALTDDAGPRMRRLLHAATDRPIAIESMTDKERLVFETLLAHGGATTAADLARRAQTSTAPIQQLVRKGALVEVVERTHRDPGKGDYYAAAPAVVPDLTAEQTAVLEKLRASFADNRRPVLVRGVTCSGKTEIYLRWAGELLAKGLNVIVLVPEISLTPQMLKRFRDRFGHDVAVLHSGLADGERFDQWELIRQGKRRVVVGARSAVFAPLPNLGCIILDEEGEPSFKQDTPPRYHAREVAAERCRLANAQLVMGSATPTLEAYQRALDCKYELIHLTQRVTDRRPPQVDLVDMRHELTARHNRSVFSQTLRDALATVLKNGEQAILFINRRGHSSFVLCRACGHAVGCSRCQVSLVFHEGQQLLRCHYCGEVQGQPKQCPACGSEQIRYFGAGTQRIETETRRHFPKARVQRLDSDSVSTRGSLETILDRFGRRELDILIGTQMVAKGLDFPGVTLVGILAADSVLRLPDFRAAERTFSLLAQVAGRAGRGDRPGRVILQTYNPNHHAIRHALTEDFLAFFADELRMRRETRFPPLVRLIGFLVSGPDLDKARDAGTVLAEELRKVAAAGQHHGEVWGPAPAAIEVINRQHRFQLLYKTDDLDAELPALNAMLRRAKLGAAVHLAVDPDPYMML